MTTTLHPLAAALDPAVPECPPSATADAIVHWTNSDGSLNVQTGEVVLHGGQLETIAQIEYSPGDRDLWVRYVGDYNPWGSLSTHVFDAAEQVAVRRYTTGVAEAETGSEKEAQAAA
jgi:hypothetical protein